MSSKIKGILACAVAMILTVYVGGLLGMGTISPIPALMVGGAAGIICGAAIAIIRQGSAPLAVGIGTMAVLWTVVSVVIFICGVMVGITITARRPIFFAASATPWA